MHLTLSFYIVVVLISVSLGRRQLSSQQREDTNIKVEEKASDAAGVSISDYLKAPTVYEGKDSIKDRKLLHEKLSIKNILNSHHLYTPNSRQFHKEVLTYVTPWNKKGYILSKLMISKIDWLVPVWFQLKKSNTGVISIGGEEDIDYKWLKEIRKLSEKTLNVTVEQEINEDNNSPLSFSRPLRILPRVALEASLDNNNEMSVAISILTKLQKSLQVDGFTFELPLEDLNSCLHFLKLFKEKCKNCYVIVVLPPFILATDQGSAATLNALYHLSFYVDRYSVMTYDKNKMTSFHGAPISWVKTVITGLSQEIPSNDLSTPKTTTTTTKTTTEIQEDSFSSIAKILLLGIPLYGWRGREAVTSDDMIIWMASGGVTVTWDETAKEHQFAKHGQHSCYFPTPLFVWHRLRLAEQMDVAGVAFWELGQTMALTMDLL